jgi:hypothetical protein
MHGIKYFFLNKNDQTIRGGGQKQFPKRGTYRKHYRKTLIFKIQGARTPPGFTWVRPWAQQQLWQLQSKIGNIQLQQVPNDAIWTRHKTGEFNTWWAYKFINETPMYKRIFFEYGRSKLHRECRSSCGWCWEKITIDNLIKKRWTMINMYYLCRDNLETVDHILTECIYTKQ